LSRKVQNSIASIVFPIEKYDKFRLMEKKKYTNEKPLTKKEVATNKTFIPRLVSIIEMTYASFGIQVKVVEVHVRDKFITFGIEITMGTKIDKILKLDKELSLALAAPGMVDIHLEPGRDLIYIDVPKGKTKLAEGKYKIIKIYQESKGETGKLTESEFYNDLKIFVRFVLIKIGSFFYWLEKKIPRRSLYIVDLPESKEEENNPF